MKLETNEAASLSLSNSFGVCAATKTITTTYIRNILEHARAFNSKKSNTKPRGVKRWLLAE